MGREMKGAMVEINEEEVETIFDFLGFLLSGDLRI